MPADMAGLFAFVVQNSGRTISSILILSGTVCVANGRDE
jgi:hypothetical protein